MPGPMPYYLEKGYTLSVLESYLNDSSHADILAAFGHISAKNAAGTYTNRLVDSPFFNTTSLDFEETYAGGQTISWTTAKWKQHLNQHWFGLVGANGQSVSPAKAKSVQEAASWWINYWGDDVEGIVRETMILAIETAYRVDHGKPLPAAGVERWPIEVFWKCGQAWFEGWVTWRKLPGGQDRGLVTLMFCTPAESTGTHFLWWSPIPDPTDVKGKADPYDKLLTGLGKAHAGMVVVTHKENLPKAYGPRNVSDAMLGKLVPPPVGTVYHGTGDVVAVQPAAARGGVSSTPKQWAAKPEGGNT